MPKKAIGSVDYLGAYFDILYILSQITWHQYFLMKTTSICFLDRISPRILNLYSEFGHSSPFIKYRLLVIYTFWNMISWFNISIPIPAYKCVEFIPLQNFEFKLIKSVVKCGTNGLSDYQDFYIVPLLCPTIPLWSNTWHSFLLQFTPAL